MRPNVRQIEHQDLAGRAADQDVAPGGVHRDDLDLERAAIERLNQGIGLCVAERDNGSRDLLEDILEGEEEHADWLKSQLELIRQVGEAHYLAQQIHPDD